MWFFNSPEIVFGEDALERLGELSGKRAMIVTDANIVRLGFVERVQKVLSVAGIESAVFAEVEPDPSVQIAQQCAAAMTEYEPDWIVGLGGGSCIDTGKAAWLLYERPDVEPAAINPFDEFGLRARARFVSIATTSGTGADITWATVLTDTEEQRKLGLGSRELMPDIAIVDPSFVMSLPPQITADTGMDALTHAIEGYTNTYHNDFCDGLCLQAIKLVFEHLPRAFADGADAEARERMHNAAAVAGLGFGNSMAGLAHAMGHALGAAFHIPHGRAVGLFLPYTVEFTVNAGGERYADIAHFLRLPANDKAEGASSLVAAIREMAQNISQPTCIRQEGISPETFEEAMPLLIANAESDTSLVMSERIPDSEELEKLFLYAYKGRAVDF